MIIILHMVWNMNLKIYKETRNSLDESVQGYKITDEMVENKKKIMLDAFPYAKNK